MQNRYVGDVGDFGKFGLLRFLSGLTDPIQTDRHLRVGVNWYMHHEQHSAFGHHTGYLVRTPKDDKREYWDCDADLWDRLRDLMIQPETRCVHCVEQAGILPDDTLFHSDFLGYPTGMTRAKRMEQRGDWFAAALRATEGAYLVFVDPDNGLEVWPESHWPGFALRRADVFQSYSAWQCMRYVPRTH